MTDASVVDGPESLGNVRNLREAVERAAEHAGATQPLWAAHPFDAATDAVFYFDVVPNLAILATAGPAAALAR